MPDNSQPATKQDLIDVRTDLREEMRQMEDRLVEKMRDLQTEVLTAFHNWGRTMEARIRVLPLLDERLTVLEDRMSQLEREIHPKQ